VMRRGTGLDPNQARLQLLEERIVSSAARSHFPVEAAAS
jgi:hypothetical protein